MWCFIQDLSLTLHSFFFTGVAYQLAIGDMSSVTTSYWVKDLPLSFGLSTKSATEFECYKVTCRNGL